MIEQFIYETRPFLYLGGAFVGRHLYASSMMTGFTTLLVVCTGLILFWRYQNRYAGGPR